MDDFSQAKLMLKFILRDLLREKRTAYLLPWISSKYINFTNSNLIYTKQDYINVTNKLKKIQFDKYEYILKKTKNDDALFFTMLHQLFLSEFENLYTIDEIASALWKIFNRWAGYKDLELYEVFKKDINKFKKYFINAVLGGWFSRNFLINVKKLETRKSNTRTRSQAKKKEKNNNTRSHAIRVMQQQGYLPCYYKKK